MPDTLSLSAGISLGLVAGIVSGVCYLFANGYTRPRDENRRVSKEGCVAAKEKHICGKCGGDENGGVIPCVCYHHQPQKFESGAWFLRQVQRAISLMPWSFSTELEQIEEEEHEGSETSETRVDLQHVRDFLEALSARLAGGALEGTRVAPLYHHPAYVSLFERHHATLRNSLADLSTALRDALKHLPQTPGQAVPGPTSSASSAHSQLKRLVARVVEEAAALPALAQYAAEPHTPVESSTYEDLLATAILNKVIERYQTENGSGGRSSGIHSASASPSPSERSSPRSLNSRNRRDLRDITPPLQEEEDVIEWEDGEAGEDVIELPRRVPFPEYGGDIVHPIENEYRDFDEVSGSDIQAVDGSWEENWLFQKKKINTIQSVPVPMLVPNSNTEYKALIGDRDADDTTDLSDNASEDEAEEIEYKSDVKKVLESKHIIGGQPKLDEVLDFEPDSLTIINGNESEEMLDSIENYTEENLNNKDISKNEIVENHNDHHDSILVIGVDSGPISKTEFNLKEEIHRTMNGDHVDGLHEDTAGDTAEPYSLGADVKCSENSFTYTNNSTAQNTLSRHEREGEYEETVTMPVQRYADSLRRKHFEDTVESQPTQDPVEDLIPGSIAYRERKKWLNYVDMPNNPYSPEAIKKRLTAKSTSTLFDTITKNEENRTTSPENFDSNEPDSLDGIVENREIKKSATTDCVNTQRSVSPAPKVLKDVLSEEIPQYRRYGRDYYIKEAKSSSGGRKYNSYSDTSSITSSMNKSTSLDNFDTEFASPVSASSSLSDLEATALHQNIVRAVLSPRHASPNFAINPIFENPDRSDKDRVATDARADRDEVRLNTNIDGGDGYVENEDIVRLKIPKKPEITEDLFETYTKVRRSNTLRSEDLCVRVKRRPALNFTFGGSLRLSKGFHKNLCITTVAPREVGLLIKQFKTIAINQEYTKFAVNDKENISITTMPNEYKNEILIEYEDSNEQTLFVAKPANTDEDTDRQFEEILQSAYKTDKEQVAEIIDDIIGEAQKSLASFDHQSSYSSSSLEDTIKIYNVQTGEIVKCKPEDNVSSLRYERNGDKNDNTDMTDKAILGEDDKFSETCVSDGETIIVTDAEDSEKQLEGANELDDIPTQLPNVRELAKKFSSMESLSEPHKPSQNIRRQKSKENLADTEKPGSKLTYMHSLTARSISKEFRDELKLSLATPLKVPGGSKEIPEGAEDVTRESSRPGSPVPEPGTIKTKLAFFESLKAKISNK